MNSHLFRSLFLGLGLLLVVSGAVFAQVTVEQAKEDDPNFAREIVGAVDLGAGRMLGWEQVSDGSGVKPLRLFEPGKAPRHVGWVRGEEVAGAVGSGVVVLAAAGKLFTTSADAPGRLAPVALEGEWLSVARGPRGFVAGGAGDAVAVSSDGLGWTKVPAKRKGDGLLTVLASGGGKFAALRQTSEDREGWGVNVSEICELGADGRSWKVLGKVKGGADRSPLQTLRWAGGRWVAVGMETIFTAKEDGSTETITPEFPEAVTYGLMGHEAVFFQEGKWLLMHGEQVLESADLKGWRIQAPLPEDKLRGLWLGDADGAPAFVGRAAPDFRVYRRLALSEAVELATAATPAATPAAAVVEKPQAAPTTPGLPFFEEDSPGLSRPAVVKQTNYDWPALVAEASRRAAGRSPAEGSTLQPKGQKTPLSLGRRWGATDVLAAIERGADPREIMRTMETDYDGSEIDMRGALTILTSPAWIAALEKLDERDAAGVRVELWTQVYPRSHFADELAQLVIERRRGDLGATPVPADDAELRRRYAAGEPAAAYTLYLLHYYSAKGFVTSPPADVPPEADLIKLATSGGYAPAQWLIAQRDRDMDPLRRLALIRLSAEAGDAPAAFALAKLFAPVDSSGVVAANYAEVEYWMLEAAARAWPGLMDQIYRRPWIELANLYSARMPNDHLSSTLPTYEDATARWLRILESRGGELADFARKAVRQFELETARNTNPFAYQKRLARMPPERPLFTVAELGALEAAAGRREPAALMTLADAYAGGRGTRQDDVKALALYHAAAEAGAGLPAYQALARHHDKGQGVKRDPEAVLGWMRKAADTGDQESMRALADRQHYTYTERESIPQNYASAMALYEKLAARDDAKAMYGLALMHRYGRGVPKDEAKAREWLAKAAALGNTEAMTDLAAREIDRDLPFEKRNYPAAIEWYRKAVAAGEGRARSGLASALASAGRQEEARALRIELAKEDRHDFYSRYELAQMELRAGRRAEAMRWYREVMANRVAYDYMREEANRLVSEYDEEEKAKPGTLPHYRRRAFEGKAEDWYQYGIRYAAASAPKSTERATALIWIRDAAQEGHAGATAFYYGDLAQSDKAAASAWLKEQAEKGNAQAILITGLETAASDKAAGLALMEKAAAAGNLEALFRLGMMQYQGQELPQDRAVGIQRITTAADAGFAAAQFMLGKALLTGDVGLGAAPDRGIGYLRKAAAEELQPAVAIQAWVLLGQVYQSGQVTGVPRDLGKAVEAFEAAAKIDPRNAQLSQHLIQLRAEYSRAMKMGTK